MQSFPESSKDPGHYKSSELIQCIPTSVDTVQGRLREHSDFWLRELECSKFVRDIVTEGYRMPFIQIPERNFQKNHVHSKGDCEFVENALLDLVNNRCIVETNACPTVCSPLQVVTSSKGKQRLVIDLRHINQYLHKCKFKYEGLDIVTQMFEKGDYFTTFDLKSGYHHVDIHSDHWQFLGLSWEFSNVTRFFQFRVLPFGLATACYVFTKLLRPLVKRWRSLGLRVVIYIDDGICAATSIDKGKADTGIIVRDLDKAGFILNMEKSKLSPQQSGKWLGIEIDLVNGNFFIPEDRIDRLKASLDLIAPFQRTTARILARITGQIISMSIALGPVTRLRTRSMYAVINCRQYWNEVLPIDRDTYDELVFWYNNISSLNGQPIWFSSGATRIAYSDASSTGFGGYVVEIGPQVSQGQWSTSEAVLSSTWRELKAVDQVLRSFVKKLSGHIIKWYTDNQNVVRIIQCGSRKPHLQDGAMSIYQLCISNGIKLEMAWIPRTLNEYADSISRIVDYDDWMMDISIFNYLDQLWGPHTIDNFASSANNHLPQFHSRFWDPHCSAVDTFTTAWTNEMNWLVPPLHLVNRALRHARNCAARCTLVVPAWTSTPFWPSLFPSNGCMASYIHGWQSFPYYPGIIKAGHSGNNLGDSLTTDSIILAFLIDFAIPQRDQSSNPMFTFQV